MNIILLMIEIIFKEKIKVTTTGLENIFKGNLFIFLRCGHDQQNENLSSITIADIMQVQLKMTK